jgi:hypothetical protein
VTSGLRSASASMRGEAARHHRGLGITFGGLIGYLTAGFIGASIVIAIARAFQRQSSAANLICVAPRPCVAGHIKKQRGAGPDLCAPFPSPGCPRTRKGSQTEGLTMQCGAPAAPRRRHEKIPGRNRIGPVALNGPGPGGRAPSSPTPSPHPADRPRSSAKGRGLPFRGHRYAVGSNLSLGGVRRRIEALMLPDEPIVELNLDRAVRQETGGSEVVRAGPAMPGRATDRAAPASNLSSKFPPVGRRRHGGFKKSVATPAKTRHRPS